MIFYCNVLRPQGPQWSSLERSIRALIFTSHVSMLHRPTGVAHLFTVSCSLLQSPTGVGNCFGNTREIIFTNNMFIFVKYVTLAILESIFSFRYPKLIIIGRTRDVYRIYRVMDRKTKCANCQLKVGVYGFTCRCKNVFCSACRFPKNEVSTGHECGFDFSQLGRAAIVNNNPKVVNLKIDSI